MRQDIDRIVSDFERGRISRRQLVTNLMAFGAAAAGVSALAAAQDEPPRAETRRPESTFDGVDLNHIALRVTDIERSSAFYQKHLGLTMSSQTRSSAFLRCSRQNFVALFRADDPGMDHYCFGIAEYDPANVVKKLEAVGIETRRHGNRVYFDDPDGIEVQVSAQEHNV